MQKQMEQMQQQMQQLQQENLKLKDQSQFRMAEMEMKQRESQFDMQMKEREAQFEMRLAEFKAQTEMRIKEHKVLLDAATEENAKSAIKFERKDGKVAKVTNAKGQQFEIQRDASGKLIGLKPATTTLQ